MQLRAIPSIGEIDPRRWNALQGADNPFLRHEFLEALERHGAVSRENGWVPYHLLLEDGETLAAAAPAYIKGNSWGEFVFDFAWAHAYERNGLEYYPKLIIAVPYSPVNGPRMLLNPDYPAEGLRHALADGARQMADAMEISSVHWLFARDADMEILEEADYARREGCQYHWRNAGYADFDDFLDGLEAGEPFYLESPSGNGWLPPRRIDPETGERELTERPLPETGEILTSTITNVAGPSFVEDAPYVVAIAEFGPVRITGQVRGVDPEDVEIGQAVSVGVGASERGERLVVFEPI